MLILEDRYCCRNGKKASKVRAFNESCYLTCEKANEVLPVVKKTPVIAGVCATDPFRNIPAFLKQLKDLGFAGVQNFPTVGLIDGQFRDNLEETGMSFDKEVEMIRLAHEQDMLTTPYVFNVGESKKMAKAGADVLVCHMGLTVMSHQNLPPTLK